MAVGALVLLALVVLTAPPRRLGRFARRAGGGRDGRGGGRGDGRARGGAERRRWGQRRWGDRGRPRVFDPGLMVSEVGLRLRAGSAPARAWTTALRRAGVVPDDEEVGLDPTGVPRDLIAVAERLAGGSGRRRARDGGRRGIGAGGAGSGGRTASSRIPLGGRAERAAATSAMAGVLVACRVTHGTGAPLADVLDRSAAGIAEAGRAAGARAVALAGPRATGRLLGWLPVLGLLLGGVVGADPVGTLTDGGIGTVCLVVGLVMLTVGWVWVIRAERSAEGHGP